MRPVCIRNKRYARTCTAVAHKRSSVQLQRRKRNSCRSFVLRYKSGAYVAEIVRAGIESIDKGQTEAGRSLGLGAGQTMWLIVLPQAIKNILPALGNEFIVLVKETSIAGYIAVTDITKAAQYVGSKTYDLITPLLIAAAFYLILVFILTKLQKLLERRLGKSDRR